jgi:hypothetical protein
MSTINKIHTRYYLKDGKTQVAGVTTIIGMIGNPALIHWAWELGCKGEDYRKIRDKAGSIGTITHYLIEKHLKGEKPDLSEFSPANVDKAENAFLAFLDFEKSHKLKPIKQEFPLVSEKYGFGGTIDLYAELDDVSCLIDFKTSSGLWPSMRVQVAAYEELLKENGYKVDGVHLLRIDKETGEFSHHPLKDLSLEWKLFVKLTEAYPLKTVIWKKR